MNAAWTDSPVGPLTLWETGGAICRLDWAAVTSGTQTPVLAGATAELDAYFAGMLTTFTTPWTAGTTPFQRAFLTALAAIPFGTTRTYGDLAKDLGVSPQAIGQACGANPIPIIIPCHRVLAADGLGGFSGAGGVEAKVALLKHEGAASLLL